MKKKRSGSRIYLFRVYVGDEISYPVMWGLSWTIYKDPYEPTQYFMESVSRTPVFFTPGGEVMMSSGNS